MHKLTIITQNLNREIDGTREDSKILKEIKEKYTVAGVREDDIENVDIYAFQELGYEKDGQHLTAKTIIVESPYCENLGISNCAEKIWNEAFSQFKTFRNGFWDERDIKFAGKPIKIINVHCSPTYTFTIRYTLLKRLSDLKGFLDGPDGLMIVLGDFNAAFCGITGPKQTQSELSDGIIESEYFLKQITEKYGFTECTAKDESEKMPRYTFSYKGKSKKLDHIFISESLFKLLQDSNPDMPKERPYEIIYINEVNRNHDSKSKDAFTDHSGIKLTITLPDAKN